MDNEHVHKSPNVQIFQSFHTSVNVIMPFFQLNRLRRTRSRASRGSVDKSRTSDSGTPSSANEYRQLANANFLGRLRLRLRGPKRNAYSEVPSAGEVPSTGDVPMLATCLRPTFLRLQSRRSTLPANRKHVRRISSSLLWRYPLSTFRPALRIPARRRGGSQC